MKSTNALQCTSVTYLRASDGFQRVENIEGRSMRVYVVTAALMSEPDCG